MLRLAVASALVVIVGGAVVHADDARVDQERVVPADRLAQDVAIRDVRTTGGVVTGTVVNRSSSTVRDVRLTIRNKWLWNDEFHPGTDDPSRADFITVPGPIPPGGQQDFTYRGASDLPDRRDGHFETDVAVASVVEVKPDSPVVEPRTTAPAAPTAGAPRDY
jgi:hypothetical protein